MAHCNVQVRQPGFSGSHCDCVVFCFKFQSFNLFCAQNLNIVSVHITYICIFRPVAHLIIEHVMNMATTSKSGIKHKKLPI